MCTNIADSPFTITPVWNSALLKWARMGENGMIDAVFQTHRQGKS